MDLVVPFGELLDGATVRATTINGKNYLSIRDLIMVVCEKTSKRASETWIKTIGENQKEELLIFMKKFQFRGPGEKYQDVIEFEGALRLINWLPGNNAKDYRGKATNVIKRYMAGDWTLVKEIEANAASDNPINQFARASAGTSVENNDAYSRKRQRMIEDIELEEKRLKNEDLASIIRMRNADAQMRENEAEKFSLELEKQQAEARLEMERKEAEARLEMERKEAEARLEMERKEAEARLEMERKEAEARLELERKEAETKMRAEKHEAELRILNAQARRLEADAPQKVEVQPEWASNPNSALFVAKFLSAVINSQKYISEGETLGEIVVRISSKIIFRDFLHFLEVYKCSYWVSSPTFVKYMKFVGGVHKDKSNPFWIIHFAIATEYLKGNGTYDSQIAFK